jgi:hypothetical protein
VGGLKAGLRDCLANPKIKQVSYYILSKLQGTFDIFLFELTTLFTASNP